MAICSGRATFANHDSLGSNQYHYVRKIEAIVMAQNSQNLGGKHIARHKRAPEDELQGTSNADDVAIDVESTEGDRDFTEIMCHNTVVLVRGYNRRHAVGGWRQ
ncbi:hypothetical protein BDV93DRAFT_516912 [Ceratobasidium sp. AG-I]|nr:hypothetical protein BDV93DRAFT_516912 [Ceratobasidium sp. AG-I]